MEVYLDGRALDSREALHQALSALLAFPAYYGKNLDALHDCLTDLSDPVHLTVLHAQALEDALGAYCRIFQRVLSDSRARRRLTPTRKCAIGLYMPSAQRRRERAPAPSDSAQRLLPSARGLSNRPDGTRRWSRPSAPRRAPI